MDATINKEQLTKSLKQLAIDEPDFVKTLLREITEELKHAKRQRLEQIVNEDFAEYEEVFRALA
jgi:hypothetical protein